MSYVAFTLRAVLWLAIVGRQCFEQIEGLVERHRATGGDVEDFSRDSVGRGLAGQIIRFYHVVDVSEVATLVAIPIDRGLLATEHRRNEFGEHPGIWRGGILPRSEDIEVAQADGLKLVAAVKRNHVMLAG